VDTVNESFVRERITALRLKKGVSEYKMSTDLGHSKSYIQSIASGRSMPSFSEFLYMCEYLAISPRDFFDEDIENPAMLQQVINALKPLKDDDLILILNTVERLHRYN
jgi:transcriptional regulator with XRE-family HTH domain